MRKLKLLLASVALLVGGGISVYADDVFKDITTGKITNPSFESAGAVVAERNTTGDLTTGWKITAIDYARIAIFDNDDVPASNTYGASNPSNGSYYLMVRSNLTDYTRTQNIQQKDAFSLPLGTYKIKYDYKAAKCSSYDMFFTISAKDGSTAKGSKKITIEKKSKDTSYFSGISWTTADFDFSLTDTKNITLDISCQTRGVSEGHTVILLDNFILQWNLTASLQSLLDVANDFYTAEGTTYTALKTAIDNAEANKGSDNASTLETHYNTLAVALDLAKNHRKPWLTAWTTANTNYSSDTYTNVTGTEKTDLKTEIDKSEPSTADDYDSAKDDLVTANTNFTAAKTNYDALVTVNGLITSTGTLSYADPDKKPTTEEATSASEAGTKAASQYTALRAYYESHAAAENVATAFDKTSALTNPDATDGNNGWTWTGTKNDPKSDEAWTDASGSSSHNYFDGGNWNGNPWITTMSQTISLPVGTYLLTTKGRAAENTTLTMAVGAVEVALPHVGNSGNVFNRGWCDASLEFTSDGSDVTILVTASSNTIHEWFSIGDFRLIKLDATYADDDDYAALAAAISTIEGSLGFDAGEYAPYNVASALATAKAFNPAEDNIQSEVQDATAALLALTTNVTEVDAVYNGCFDDDFTGWTRSSDWGTCISVSGDYTTAYRNYQGYLKYGDTGYYTMPLKANTYYTLKTAYRSQQSISYTLRVTASVKKGEEGLSDTPNWPWTSNTSTWSKPSVTFKTGSAGNYILKLQNTADTQITGVSLRRATAAEVKPILEAELTAANTLYNSGANVGSGVFQIPTASGTAFSSAIETAQGVYDNGSATVDEVADAIADLQTAKTTYANATLNAPDSEKRYHLTIVRDGKAWDGKAITFMEGAANPTQGNYGIKYLTAANANMCQAVKFTNTTGNKYKVSFLTRAGVEQYITTSNLGYSAGTDNTNKERIRTVDDASKALEIEIQATTTANQFRLYNTDRGAVIADNNNNDVYTNNSANFTISEASQVSVAINIADNVKLATRIFPFTPVLPSGVKAYSCEASAGDNLTLVEVAEPAANTPYILYAEEGYDGAALTGYGTAAADSYKVGWLTGVYTTSAAPNGSYVLQNGADGVAFYLVDTSEATPSVGAYRCYLTVPTTARALYINFDEATAVETIKALTSGKNTIYNAAGAEVPSLQKGLNIIKTSDGTIRKVMVK